MNKIFSMAGMAFTAILLFAACSTSGGDDQTPDPIGPLPTDSTELKITPGTDERPSWTAPLAGDGQFDGIPMSVQIGLQAELLPYLSDNDLMCAMIGGEVRAVANPHETGGQHYFPLSILGSNGEGYVILKYYCDQLHRIFTAEQWRVFDSSIQPTVGGKPYEVQFVY